ncbi:MAG: glycosyltransferase family 1 protein [Beijerinckiaceae bacterium]|nr:glycosyltransferase family 1 protein [Beijerinckiaceae bacterium]
MKILIATDAWHPQINGVVRSLQQMADELEKIGVTVAFLTPQMFKTVPMPTYPEIRLSLASQMAIARHVRQFAPDYIHVATEGPIGFQVRRYCLNAGRAFTTSYHTRFPEYISARFPIPERMSYAVLRWFHNAGHGVMVTTASMRAELAARGFKNILPWSRGVDADLFRPRPAEELRLPEFEGLAKPFFLYVGRVAVEKNLEAFLTLDLPGTKLVVGDGPHKAALEQRFADARFLGVRVGEDLARVYAASDVFVFPSLTDTFGIVLLEALAAGVPVAAFPVTGPKDALGDSDIAVLDTDLRKAALAALNIPRERCRAFALGKTWAESARQFLKNASLAASLATHELPIEAAIDNGVIEPVLPAQPKTLESAVSEETPAERDRRAGRKVERTAAMALDA